MRFRASHGSGKLTVSSATATMTLQTARNVRSLLLAYVGRALLTLVAVLLVVMPWTEYFCNFDKFLRGGQDLELGLLCVLTVLCLVLVLFQHGRALVAFLISMRRWLAGFPRSVEAPLCWDRRDRFGELLASALPGCSGYSMPLQI